MEEELEIALEEEETLEVEIENDLIKVIEKDYEELKNKPSINDVTLEGNKTLDDLDIQIKGNYADTRVTNLEIDNLF